jgi:hypothetical protein
MKTSLTLRDRIDQAVFTAIDSRSLIDHALVQKNRRFGTPPLAAKDGGHAGDAGVIPGLATLVAIPRARACALPRSVGTGRAECPRVPGPG